MESNTVEIAQPKASSSNLRILQDVQRVYEDRMTAIEASSNGACDKLQMQVKLLRSWVSDLKSQNSMLVHVVEDLETEATSKVVVERRKNAELMTELQEEVCSLRRRMARKDSDLRGLIEILRRLREFDYCSTDGIHFHEVTESDIFGPLEWKKPYCEKITELKKYSDSLQKENIAKEREIRRLNKDVQQYEQTILSLRKDINHCRHVNTADVPKTDTETMTEYYTSREPSSETIRILRKENVGFSKEVYALRRICAALDQECCKAKTHALFKDEIIREMRRQLKQAKEKARRDSPAREHSSRSSSECRVLDRINRLLFDPDSAFRIWNVTFPSSSRRAWSADEESRDTRSRSTSPRESTSHQKGFKPKLSSLRNIVSLRSRERHPRSEDLDDMICNEDAVCRGQTSADCVAELCTRDCIDDPYDTKRKIISNQKETVRVQDSSLKLASSHIEELTERNKKLRQELEQGAAAGLPTDDDRNRMEAGTSTDPGEGVSTGKLSEPQQTIAPDEDEANRNRKMSRLKDDANLHDAPYQGETVIPAVTFSDPLIPSTSPAPVVPDSCVSNTQEPQNQWNIFRNYQNDLSMIEELYAECFYETVKQDELLQLYRRSCLDVRLQEEQRCSQVHQLHAVIAHQESSLQRCHDIAVEVEVLKSEILNFINSSSNNDSGVWEEGGAELDVAEELRELAALLQRLRDALRDDLEGRCVCSLMKEITQLKKQLAALQSAQTQPRENVPELQRQNVPELNRENVPELLKLQEENADLREKIRSMESERPDTHTDRETETEIEKDKMFKRRRASFYVKNPQAAIEELHGKIHKLEITVKDKEKALEECRQMMGKDAQSEREEYWEKLAKMEETIRLKDRALEKYDDSIKVAREKQFLIVEDAEKKLKEERESSRLEIKELRDQIRTLKSRKDTSVDGEAFTGPSEQSEVEELQKRVEELETELRSKEEELTELSSKKSIKNLKTQLAAKNKEIEEMRMKFRQLVNMDINKDRELTDYHNTKLSGEEIKIALNEIAAKHKKLRLENAELQADLAAMTERVRLMKAGHLNDETIEYRSHEAAQTTREMQETIEEQHEMIHKLEADFKLNTLELIKAKNTIKLEKRIYCEKEEMIEKIQDLEKLLAENNAEVDRYRKFKIVLKGKHENPEAQQKIRNLEALVEEKQKQIEKFKKETGHTKKPTEGDEKDGETLVKVHSMGSRESKTTKLRDMVREMEAVVAEKEKMIEVEDKESMMKHQQYQSELETAQAMLDADTTEIARLKEQLRIAKDEARSNTVKLRKTVRKLEAALDEREKLKEENIKLQVSPDKGKISSKDYNKNEFVRARALFNESASNLKDQLRKADDEVQKETKNLRVTFRDLDAALLDKEKMEDSQQKSAEKQAKENESDEFKKTREQLNAKATEIQGLKARLHQAEDDIQSKTDKLRETVRSLDAALADKEKIIEANKKSKKNTGSIQLKDSEDMKTQAMLEASTTKVENLRGKLREAKDEVKSKMDMVRATIRELDVALTEKDKLMMGYETKPEDNKLAKKHSDVMKALKVSEAKESQILALKERLRRAESEVQAKADKLQKTIGSLDDALGNKDKMMGQEKLESARNISEKEEDFFELKKARELLKVKTSEIATLKEQLRLSRKPAFETDDVREQIQDLEAELADKDKMLEEYKKSKPQVTTSSDDEETEVMKARKIIEEKESQILELTERLQRAEGQIQDKKDKLHKTIQVLDNAFDDKEKMIKEHEIPEDKTPKKGDLENELEKAHELLKAKSLEIANLKEQMLPGKSESDAALREKIESLEAELADKNKHIEEYKMSNIQPDELSSEKRDDQNELQQALSMIKANESEMRNLKKQLSEAKNEVQSDSENLRETIRDLQAALAQKENVTTENAELKPEVKMAEKEDVHVHVQTSEPLKTKSSEVKCFADRSCQGVQEESEKLREAIRDMEKALALKDKLIEDYEKSKMTTEKWQQEKTMETEDTSAKLHPIQASKANSSGTASFKEQTCQCDLESERDQLRVKIQDLEAQLAMKPKQLPNNKWPESKTSEDEEEKKLEEVRAILETNYSPQSTSYKEQSCQCVIETEGELEQKTCQIELEKTRALLDANAVEIAKLKEQMRQNKPEKQEEPSNNEDNQHELGKARELLQANAVEMENIRKAFCRAQLESNELRQDVRDLEVALAGKEQLVDSFKKGEEVAIKRHSDLAEEYRRLTEQHRVLIYETESLRKKLHELEKIKRKDCHCKDKNKELTQLREELRQAKLGSTALRNSEANETVERIHNLEQPANSPANLIGSNIVNQLEKKDFSRNSNEKTLDSKELVPKTSKQQLNELAPRRSKEILNETELEEKIKGLLETELKETGSQSTVVEGSKTESVHVILEEKTSVIQGNVLKSSTPELKMTTPEKSKTDTNEIVPDDSHTNSNEMAAEDIKIDSNILDDTKIHSKVTVVEENKEDSNVSVSEESKADSNKTVPEENEKDIVSEEIKTNSDVTESQDSNKDSTDLTTTTTNTEETEITSNEIVSKDSNQNSKETESEDKLTDSNETVSEESQKKSGSSTVADSSNSDEMETQNLEKDSGETISEDRETDSPDTTNEANLQETTVEDTKEKEDKTEPQPSSVNKDKTYSHFLVLEHKKSVKTGLYSTASARETGTHVSKLGDKETVSKVSAKRIEFHMSLVCDKNNNNKIDNKTSFEESNMSVNDNRSSVLESIVMSTNENSSKQDSKTSMYYVIEHPYKEQRASLLANSNSSQGSPQPNDMHMVQFQDRLRLYKSEAKREMEEQRKRIRELEAALSHKELQLAQYKREKQEHSDKSQSVVNDLDETQGVFLATAMSRLRQELRKVKFDSERESSELVETIRNLEGRLCQCSNEDVVRLRDNICMLKATIEERDRCLNETREQLEAKDNELKLCQEALRAMEEESRPNMTLKRETSCLMMQLEKSNVLLGKQSSDIAKLQQKCQQQEGAIMFLKDAFGQTDDELISFEQRSAGVQAASQTSGPGAGAGALREELRRVRRAYAELDHCYKASCQSARCLQRQLSAASSAGAALSAESRRVLRGVRAWTRRARTLQREQCDKIVELEQTVETLRRRTRDQRCTSEAPGPARDDLRDSSKLSLNLEPPEGLLTSLQQRIDHTARLCEPHRESLREPHREPPPEPRTTERLHEARRMLHELTRPVMDKFFSGRERRGSVQERDGERPSCSTGPVPPLRRSKSTIVRRSVGASPSESGTVGGVGVVGGLGGEGSVSSREEESRWSRQYRTAPASDAGRITRLDTSWSPTDEMLWRLEQLQHAYHSGQRRWARRPE